MDTELIIKEALIVLIFILIFIYINRKRKRIKDDNDLIDILEESDFSDKPICVFSIKNTSDEPKESVLFGMSNYLNSKNFGSDDGIEIRSIFCNVSYLNSLVDSGFNPFEFNVIRTEVNGRIEKQFNNNIFYTYCDSKGNLVHKIFEHKKGNRESEECVKIFLDNEYCEINHNAYISTKIEANTEVIISLYEK